MQSLTLPTPFPPFKYQIVYLKFRLLRTEYACLHEKGDWLIVTEKIFTVSSP